MGKAKVVELVLRCEECGAPVHERDVDGNSLCAECILFDQIVESIMVLARKRKSRLNRSTNRAAVGG